MHSRIFSEIHGRKFRIAHDGVILAMHITYVPEYAATYHGAFVVPSYTGMVSGEMLPEVVIRHTGDELSNRVNAHHLCALKAALEILSVPPHIFLLGVIYVSDEKLRIANRIVNGIKFAYIDPVFARFLERRELAHVDYRAD